VFQLSDWRIFLTRGLQATLSQERDQLLAEKEAWNKPSPEATEAKTTKDEWESEKADLIKNRDEALLQAKVVSLRTNTRSFSYHFRLHERRQRSSRKPNVASGCPT
jgi:hypothetical protein